MIYQFAMGSRQIHIEINPKASRPEGYSSLRYFSTCDTLITQAYHLPIDIEPISLIYLVCRRFYLETKVLAYSLNLFSCWNPLAFSSWKRGIQAECTNSIQRLSIPYYFSKDMTPEEIVDSWKCLKIVYLNISRISRYDPSQPLSPTEEYWKNHGVRVVYLKQDW